MLALLNVLAHFDIDSVVFVVLCWFKPTFH